MQWQAHTAKRCLFDNKKKELVKNVSLDYYDTPPLHLA